MLILFPLYACNGVVVEKIKPITKHKVDVKEPSDIKFDEERNSFWIVSDNGVLKECDLEGNAIRKAKYKGIDFEGVEIVGNKVLVMDETNRKVHFFDKITLEKERTIQLYYQGGRNKGFESIAYNKKEEKYYIFTEKDPTLLFIYDKEFNLTNQIEINISSDISSARWHNDNLWVLSDEDRRIVVLDNNYNVIKAYEIPIVNPEGIAFTNDNMYIVSDDLEKLYVFKKPN